MTDLQRCQSAATVPACPEKGIVLQLTVRHMELIRAAQRSLYLATAQHSSAADRDTALAGWGAAAERLTVALVANLESLEEARP